MAFFHLSAPKKAEFFGGARWSPHRAAADYFHSLLAFRLPPRHSPPGCGFSCASTTIRGVSRMTNSSRSVGGGFLKSFET